MVFVARCSTLLGVLTLLGSGVAAFPPAAASSQVPSPLPSQTIPLSLTRAASIASPDEFVSLDQSLLDQGLQPGHEGQEIGSADQLLTQMPLVNRLADVQPSDWAYQALQSLVEQYNCIVGYPDGTFQGSQPLTRYEFAVGLNACLSQISERIATSTANSVAQEDWAAVRRLQEEFAVELATLQVRVDALEGRATELEANQFSTTTTLSGEAIFSIASILGDSVSDANQPVAQTRLRLMFNTSFTGEDLLMARLQYDNLAFFNPGDNQEPRSYVEGNVVPMVTFPSPYLRETALYYQSGNEPQNSDIVLDQLIYYFPIGDRLELTLAGTGAAISDIIPSISAIDDEGSGAVGVFAYNPIYDAGFGTGAVATYYFNDEIQLGLGYLSDTAQDATPGLGLFNGNYAAFGQLTLLFDRLSVGLAYVNAYNNEEYTELPAAVSNQYGVSLNYAIGNNINLGGWFNYEDGILIGTADYRAFTYAGYLAWNDLGAENNQLVFVVGVPPRISD
jgi:hypothetical protein